MADNEPTKRKAIDSRAHNFPKRKKFDHNGQAKFNNLGRNVPFQKKVFKSNSMRGKSTRRKGVGSLINEFSEGKNLDSGMPNGRDMHNGPDMLNNSGKIAYGQNIDKEKLNYFRTFIKVQKTGTQSDEEIVKYANSALDLLQQKEKEFAFNFNGSIALQAVIPYADYEHVKTLEDAVSKDLWVVLCDKFAHHVILKLMEASAKKVENAEVEMDKSFFMKCCERLFSNPEELTQSQNSFALSAAVKSLEMLGNLNSDISCKPAKLVYTSLLESPNIQDLVKRRHNFLVQKSLRCLHSCQAKLCQKAVVRLISDIMSCKVSPSDAKEKTDPSSDKEEEADPDSDVEEVKPDAEKKEETRGLDLHSPSIHRGYISLLECAFECASEKCFSQLYAELFANKMVTLCLDKTTHVVVVKLLGSVLDPTQFEVMFDELSGSFAHLISLKKGEVIKALAETCLRLDVRQEEFIHALMEALGCSESEKQLELVPMCLEALDSRKIAKQPSPIRLDGTLTIEKMLLFKKPKKVAESILAIHSLKLLGLLKRQKGNYISNAFFRGEFVSQKSKNKLFKKLQGRFVELVVGQHGAQVVERVWEGCPLKRDALMAELSLGQPAILASKSAPMVVCKLCLSAYRPDQQQEQDDKEETSP